jgi:hypothetical protein
MRGGKEVDSTRRGTRLGEGIGEPRLWWIRREGTRRKDERGKRTDRTRRGTRLGEGIGDQGEGGSGWEGTRRKDERGKRERIAHGAEQDSGRV